MSMKILTITFYLFILLTIFSLSCSSDVKIGKGNYYGKNSRIIRGKLRGINYVMLVTSGKNKYPLTVDFRRNMKPFFAMKTTMEQNKFVAWHGFTDTTENLFRSFGTKLIDGKGLKERSFTPVSQEDRRILYEFSDKLETKKSNLVLSKDSINRLIGWVRVTE